MCAQSFWGPNDTQRDKILKKVQFREVKNKRFLKKKIELRGSEGASKVMKKKTSLGTIFFLQFFHFIAHCVMTGRENQAGCIIQILKSLGNHFLEIRGLCST